MNALSWRFWIAAIFAIPSVLVHVFSSGVEPYFSIGWVPIIEMILASLVVWFAGYPLILEWAHSFAKGPLNKFSLLGTGVLLAYSYSLWEVIAHLISGDAARPLPLNDLYFEPSAVITTLILLGELIGAKAIHQVIREFESSGELLPKLAHLLLPNGDERKIAVEDIRKGDTLRVNPGEMVPADGILKEGQSWVDQSEITGESMPLFKRPQDELIAGTLNGNSAFSMVVEKAQGDTLLSRILQLMKGTQLTKAPIQKTMEQMVAIFIPTILALAGVTFLVGLMLGESLSMSVCHAITLLVIASPSAIALGVSLPFMMGIGIGARHGILVQDVAALELLEKINALVIDKGGAITEGKPLLTKIFAKFPFTEVEVLRLGASVELHCDHPVARAIVAGAKLKQVGFREVSNARHIEAKGVIADLNGSRIVVGNKKLLEESGIVDGELIVKGEAWEKEGQTVVYVALEDRAIGLLAVSDSIRFTAERSIDQLHREKLRIVMATGDGKEVALAVGKRLQIDEVEAEMSAREKMKLVEEMQKRGNLVAMAGDGTNDALAIKKADVGIAMSADSDAFFHAVPIILLKSDLLGVVRAHSLSKAVMCKVNQNLIFSLGYNLVAPLFGMGFLGSILGFSVSPIAACLAMILSILAVIYNALRLKHLKLFD